MDSSPSTTLAAQVLEFFFDTVNDVDAFLGDCWLRERAIEAARISTAPLGASTLFVEFPLMGAPSFDLHVYPEIARTGKLSDKDLSRTCRGSGDSDSSCLHGEPGGVIRRQWPQYPDLLGWCEQYPAGMADAGFAFDLSSNADALDEPCLYAAFLEKGASSAVVPSMGMMGGAQFKPALRRMLDALPSRARVYYAGVMHGREPVVAHVGYKVGPVLAREYATQPDVLARDLQNLGFSSADAHFAGFEELAHLGFARDIQFAFDERGVVDGTLAFSYVDCGQGPFGDVESFRMGDQCKVFEYLESLGLADARWHLLEPSIGVHRVPIYAEGQVRMAAVAIRVGYIKVRWAYGKPCAPAKVYLSVKSVALCKKGSKHV